MSEEARAPSLRASVVRLAHQWFIACAADELRERPLALRLQGTPLVLYRDANGEPRALLDRCPHRNVPLSLGRCRPDGTLECAYHGWRFDSNGRCVHIPTLRGAVSALARNVATHAVCERDGWVWIWSTADEAPSHDPYRFRYLGAPDYATVRHSADAPATLFSTIENALDVPHTAFLHRGLFRSGSRGLELRVRVHRRADRVEAEYIGEPRPTGLVAKLLSPSGGTVEHFDRFILPSIAQVEYRIGNETHFVADTAATPIDDFQTRIFAVVSLRSSFLSPWIAPIVKPLALRVFAQDARILEAQTQTIRRFGEERFASTEVDVLGKHIWRLLRAAERGDHHSPEERDEVEMIV